MKQLYRNCTAVLLAGIVVVGAAAFGQGIPTVVLSYDSGTHVLTPVPWSSSGFNFGPTETFNLGIYHGYGFLLIDPPGGGGGGGRVINIPSGGGSGYTVSENGGNVTVRYSDGSSATVPGTYIPPNQIQLTKPDGNPAGENQGGKVEAPVPDPIPGDDLNRWIDDFGQEPWDMFDQPPVIDHSPLQTYFDIWPEIELDVDFTIDGPVEFTFIPEPQVSTLVILGLFGLRFWVRKATRQP